jgi:hypothetical protein
MAAHFPETGNGPYRLFRGIEDKLVRRWHLSLSDPRAAQRQRLAALLSQASGTAFARDHGLGSTETLESYRAKVPLRRYDALAPWMERVHAGEASVLTREPVRSLLKTSGTTGASKLLPVTEAYAREVREGQSIWRLALMRDHEAVSRGGALTVVSPGIEGRLPSGLAYGSNTGRMLAEQPLLVRMRYPVPEPIHAIEDGEARVYALLRFALQADLATLTTANPSTVLLLARKLLEHREDLARDLAEGSLRYGPAAGLRLPRRVRWRLRRRPVPQDWRIARLWDLATINCWKGGPARFFLQRFPAALGGEVCVREVGLTASEGYFAVPVDDGDSGGVAWLGGHLLEFLDDSGAPGWAWELQEGRRYRLVVSHTGGLYRYDLNDLVECTGFDQGAPRLRFVRKASGVLSVTGEKVSEDQVVAVMASLGEDLVGFTVGLRMAEVPAYQLAVEGRPGPDLAARFDAALQAHNVEYAAKRASARLAPMELVQLPEGAYAAYRRWRIQQGATEGQVKDLVLAARPEDWRALFAP